MEMQYDGTGLHGWAKQEGLPTVEGSLESAFQVLLGWAPVLRVAGRTDAGVHARRQIVSLGLPPEVDLTGLTASLNALTPPGVAVTSIKRAPEGFDARKEALSRSYRYFVSTAAVVSPFWSRYCWHAPRRLQYGLLQATADATMGRHDFSAFTPAETEHVFFLRTVSSCRWRRLTGERGMLALEIEADAFLRHMVRTLVGTMLEVGEGRRDPDGYLSLLGGTDREAAGPTAPAQGLFLWDVRYRTGVRTEESEHSEA